MDTLLELPLILFTLLTQLAVGLAVFAALRQWITIEGSSVKTRNEWIAILALIGVGVVAAFFHLGKPLGAIRMLANIGTAWLSREILTFAIFGLLAAISLYLVYTKAANGWMLKLTALVGLLAVFTTGMAYAGKAMDAINNLIPLVFFMLTVFTLGPAAATYFVEEKTHALLTSILFPTLLASLIVRFVVPFIWLSGNAVMNTTGQNFLASPLHWLHLVALLTGLIFVRNGKSIPTWLPIVLLIGELLGRIAFFALVVTSGANLGGVY
ncbi:MAG: dimethyl sulfoxide reductase anchor subunit [Anaerolineales bacterium]|nr:dimethyl sulfoxide reductase anchor subunit [Anaerolineales bacterium]